MNRSIKKYFNRSTLLTAAVLAAILPLNMGGCGGGGLDMGSIGNAVGGTTGNFISAGGKAATALSLDERSEDAMGQSVAMSLTSQYPLYTDPKLNHYVTLVGLTVADASPKPDIGSSWVFGILDTDTVNAFSGPNGYVFVTRGAIARMKDESELAGVLAHEISHVVSQDGLHAVKQAGLLDAGVQAAKSDQKVAQLGQLTDNFVDVILKKGYSKDQEFHADKQAVKIIVAAGYDPMGYERFLKRIGEAQKSGQTLMSTHPGTPERVEKVDAEIQKSGKGNTGATLADRFKMNAQ